MTAPGTTGFTPSTRVLWRGPGRLQLELGGHAVVVEGVDALTASALARGGAQTDDDNREVLDVLRRAGFVTRLAAVPTGQGGSGAMTAALLAPDLDALGARFGERAAAVLSARARYRVALHGGGRLPTLIGSLLAAAGVGHIHVGDSGEVHLRDAIPGGLRPADEGTRIASSAAQAIEQAAPSVSTSTTGIQSSDLVIVTTGAPLPRGLATGFALGTQAHLVAEVWGASGIVGPLVIPGRSSCLQCADLQRRERDPAWPALAAQLAATRREREPSDVCLSALIAAITALQALQFLDGEQPAALDGTLELTLPDWRIRRRSWPAHPDCRCSALLAS